MLTGAQVHDSRVFEELVDGVEPIKKPKGRPRKRPDKLLADKGYDYPRCRKVLRSRGIKARIKLHPVTQVLGGMLIHPFEQAGEVLRFYREVAASATDELTTYAALVTTPDGRGAAS